MLKRSFIIEATSVAGRDLKTAKYMAKETVELENSILDQWNLTAMEELMDSIGSLAVLKDCPGKGTLTL